MTFNGGHSCGMVPKQGFDIRADLAAPDGQFVRSDCVTLRPIAPGRRQLGFQNGFQVPR